MYRFLCADLKDRKKVTKFLSEKEIHMLYSDPPWDVAKVTYYRNIANVAHDFDLEALWRGIAWVFREFVTGCFYLEMGNRNAERFCRILLDEGLHIHAVFDAWYNNASLTYKIIYGGRSESYPFKWTPLALSKEIRTWHIMEWAIKRDTKPGENVLDCCIGFGETLKACLATGRGCYGIELSQWRLDVAIRRYERRKK